MGKRGKVANIRPGLDIRLLRRWRKRWRRRRRRRRRKEEEKEEEKRKGRKEEEEPILLGYLRLSN